MTHKTSLLPLSLLAASCAFASTASAADLVYVPLDTPCRIVNTTAGGSVVDFINQRVEPLKAWGDTAVALQNQGGGDCANPKAPQKPEAMAANVTAVTLDRRLRGSFVAFAHGGMPPAKGSLVNFFNNNIANSSIIPLADNDAFQFDVLAKKVELIPGETGSPEAGLIVDVLGYFYPQTAHSLKNIVTVSATGGMYTDPADAADAVAAKTGGEAPSANNPYLIKIGPGEYTLSRSVTMSPYVSIEGYGKGATTLKLMTNDDDPTVKGAANSSLSKLTVKREVGDTEAVAIGNDSTVDNTFHMSHLMAMATAASSVKATAIKNDGASPKIQYVTATATGGSISTAIDNTGAPADPIALAGVMAEASGASAGNIGVYLGNSAQAVIQGSTIDAKDAGSAAISQNSSTPTSVTFSTLLGGIDGTPANLSCAFNVRDGNVAINTNCE